MHPNLLAAADVTSFAYWRFISRSKECTMNTLSQIMKTPSGIRGLFSWYRPELYYMRGPGPASARRAALIQSRNVLLRQPGATLAPTLRVDAVSLTSDE